MSTMAMSHPAKRQTYSARRVQRIAARTACERQCQRLVQSRNDATVQGKGMAYLETAEERARHRCWYHTDWHLRRWWGNLAKRPRWILERCVDCRGVPKLLKRECGVDDQTLRAAQPEVWVDEGHAHPAILVQGDPDHADVSYHDRRHSQQVDSHPCLSRRSKLFSQPLLECKLKIVNLVKSGETKKEKKGKQGSFCGCSSCIIDRYRRTAMQGNAQQSINRGV